MESMEIKKPKITVVTAVYKRHDLTKYVLNKYKQMKDMNIGVNLSLVAAGSEEKISQSICENNDFMYIETPNMPLNKKWVAATKKASETDPDAIVFVNSDDVVSPDYFLKTFNKMNEKDVEFLGIRDLYFMGIGHKTLCGRMFYWPGYTGSRRDDGDEPIGAGRVFSRSLLDRLDWELWNPKDSFKNGIDGRCFAYLRQNNVKHLSIWMRDLDVAGIDIKSGFNICPLSRYQKTSNGYIKGKEKEEIMKKLYISDIFDKLDLVDCVK